MTTKILTEEARDIIGEKTAAPNAVKISIDITTRPGVERVTIEDNFTGQIILHFKMGGFAGCDKHMKIK
jgi:hypothetical protein